MAAFLRTAGALAVEVCDPFEGAGLHGPFSPAGTVPPLEHGELLLRVRGAPAAGRAGPPVTRASGAGRTGLHLAPRLSRPEGPEDRRDRKAEREGRKAERET